MTNNVQIDRNAIFTQLNELRVANDMRAIANAKTLSIDEMNDQIRMLSRNVRTSNDTSKNTSQFVAWCRDNNLNAKTCRAKLRRTKFVRDHVHASRYELNDDIKSFLLATR